MCRLSYEKCACFVFLVVLAVLSCSGFRIDDIAMTDRSKRNSHTSPSLENSSAPRLRHQSVKAVERHQTSRSSSRRRFCPELDVSWKAYKANAVAVAKSESRHCNTANTDCIVVFKVNHWLKNPSPFDDQRLTLNLHINNSYCEYNEYDHYSQLVRTRIDESKEYILFLKKDGPHNFSAVFAPEISKSKTLRVVNRVVKPDFKPKSLDIRTTQFIRSRKKFVCRVVGQPIPIIIWKRNHIVLHPKSRQVVRMTHKKRKSTLVIRSDKDPGQYECVAIGADGKQKSHVFRPNQKTGTYPVDIGTPKPFIPVTPDSERIAPPQEGERKGEPCNDKMQQYCHNGGTCFYTKVINEYSCECRTGFRGQRCEEKSSEQSSMYRQTPIYTCNVGIYTKNDDC